MSHDISQSVPQGGNGAQDAENSRIAAIADELERLCAIHEAQLRDSQADVAHGDIPVPTTVFRHIGRFLLFLFQLSCYFEYFS